MEVLQKKFRTYPIGKSKKFGIVLVEYNGFYYEVAQFRTEGAYDGRRPSKVEMTWSLREDVIRRDFTINALAMTTEGEIIDYVGGMADIERKCIRAVGNPRDRFIDDHLRLVRAARFGSADGFYIEKETRKAARKLYKLVNKIVPERIRAELIKAAEGSGPEFAKFIRILDELKLLGQILPEVHQLKYFKHNMQHHPEGLYVFDHVIECLKLTNGFDPISKIAVLFHDVGKGISLIEINGLPKYHYHAHEGAKLVEQICNRLKFSTYAKDILVYTARNHMKFHHILEMKPSKIARMVNSGNFDTLVNVGFADNFSRGDAFIHRDKFDMQVTKARQIQKRWEERVTDKRIKIVDGKRIMELLDIKPSEFVGEIKKLVEERIIDQELDPNKQDIIDTVIKEVYKDIEKSSRG